MEHMDDVLSKLEKSNKTIFIMGDFNINLLSYERHTETNDFLNSMVSHYLLPYILHPTRVTDHSSTVINNIFSNVTEYETISGSIINQIADHFAQFLLLKRINPIRPGLFSCSPGPGGGTQRPRCQKSRLTSTN